VRLAVSVQEAWDVALSMKVTDARRLATGLSSRDPVVVRGETGDGEAAIIVAGASRLAITSLSNRLSDVITLGQQSEVVRDLLLRATEQT
jgi:hypothetical protein